VLEPFLLRALLAGVGLGIVAAPLGCLVVWRRMAYFGSTIAHSGLLGVALGLLLSVNLTVSVIAVAVALALALLAIERRTTLGLDSLLGVLAETSLAAGLIAASLVSGKRLDLMGYLFGDIYAISRADLYWIWGGGAVALAIVARLWQPLIALAVHEELAQAEGVDTARAKAAFVLLLAFVIAVAMKIVGILLIAAFLIMPATAARPFAATPERMVVLAAIAASAAVAGGLTLSYRWDTAGGPTIVLVLSAMVVFALIARGRKPV